MEERRVEGDGGAAIGERIGAAPVESAAEVSERWLGEVSGEETEGGWGSTEGREKGMARRCSTEGRA